ncbi:coiled-coil domain-containing protein 146-like [Mya arenaria]|uniref:coiled-coil domain-containing protein 146-like n=1 Tax=Mya arenaria TaxID=6604 RepID=UPI0022E1D9EA|nr:coiled-coil domain-containing protein 146-like [Mya arenaria]
MSDPGAGERGEGSPDVLEYAAPISAQPPKVVHQEESQVEVSASPAFQSLDELFHEGKLTGTKVAYLKAKYTELHEMLKSTRDSEASLLKQAKECAAELERQRSELERADNFPDSSNTEVSKLRQQLLKYNNDLKQAQERQYQQEYQIEISTEEKKLMEREYARMPKAGEIEKKMKELQAACDDMKKEIVQRQLETKTLREDLDNSTRQVKKDQQEYEKEQEKMENLKGELVQVNTVPNQIAKEADKINRKNNELVTQLQEYEKEFQDMVAQKRNVENKLRGLEEEKYDMDNEVEKQKQALNDKDREMEVLQKDYEYAKDREAVLMGDRATLDLNLRHIHLEKKNAHDIHSRKMREKDRDLRNMKKAELQLRVAEENLNHNKLIYEKMKSQVDSLPKDDGTAIKKREELQKEVEQTKRALAQQNSLTAVEHVKLEASAAEEQNLLYEQSDLRIEVVELTRLAAIKADEREQKARDFMRAEMRYHKAVEDLKTKQLLIQDHEKKHKEMQIKLKDFAKLYDVIKNERNKCVNLIQTSTQKAAEMREKIKILQNEIEILRTAVTQKDRYLQKQRLKHMNSVVMRDSLRNEVAKQQRIEEEMHDKRDQQKMDIGKLNMMINSAEEQMTKLRNRYEKAITHRNERGIKLIERNEEVCIFYEKVNIQDQMIRNGSVELQAREEEIRFIKMQQNEENRSIAVLRAQLPNKTSLEQDLVTLQIQLQQCQDRMLELEKQLENPYDESRVRYLEGKDLPPAEMHEKIEDLETRLSEKEEQLLEKDLVFEQVTRLVGRVRNRAETGKDDTLDLAKKVNELQARIKDTTRKMMAMVSEVSMNQANAMKLQQSLKERESDLEQCYIRMEKGEPPSEEIERLWLKLLRDEERRIFDQEEKRLIEEEEEQYQIAGGVTTTAEPRPNAYIPDDDSELPIPRPYGKHAPFKPNEQGSTMRHIRKPVPKPIEI